MRGQKGSVLIVEDQRETREGLAAMLRDRGYTTATAANYDEGTHAIHSGGFDVAVLDMRLEDGSPGGMGLLSAIREKCPFVHVIVMTAYGTIEGAVYAMRAGAFDYIQKPFLETDLAFKLDIAMKASVQERRLAETEALLLEQLEVAESAVSSNERGSAFEIACRLAFSSVPGFIVRSNRRKGGDEIDLVIRNESTDPFWGRFSPLFLAECKNPAKPPGRAALDAFVRKLQRRTGVCNLGFFLSSTRVSRYVWREALALMREGPMVVVIDGSRLREFLRGSNRSENLKSIVEESAA